MIDLSVYTKDALIEIASQAGLATGEYARKSKAYFRELLESADQDRVQAAIDALIADGTLGAVEDDEPSDPGAAPIVATAPAAPAPVAPATGADPLQAAMQLITMLQASKGVDEAAVRSIVKAELDRSPVVKWEIKRLDGSTKVIDGHTRPEFAAVLRKATAGVNVMLVGPAGCGKTHLAHQIADALGKPFASVSCTAGMSESALQGWLLPGDGGAFEYVPSDFVTIYENGGVFLFDEIDAADPNTLLFVNQALANGGFNLPQRKGNTYVKRHADFVCIAAANTYGTGANMTYAGRERLDESTLDRFRAGIVQLGYDDTLERAAVDAQIYAWATVVRERINASRLSRVMSTRFMLDATKLIASGETLDEIKSTYFTGWKADELSKVNY